MTSLDFGDPLAVAAWLRALRDQIGDLSEAALDATAPIGERDLGRRAARKIVAESTAALASLLAQAGAFGAPEADPPPASSRRPR